MNFSSFSKDFSAWRVWQTSENHKSSVNEHDFLKQTYLLQFLNLSEKTQSLLIWQHKKHLRDISIFFSLTSWDKRKWSIWCFDIMKKEKSYQNDELKKKEMNVMRFIERTLVTWLELEQSWWNQQHQAQWACDRADRVRHVRIFSWQR